MVYLKADEGSGNTLADSTGRGHNAQIRHAWAGTPGVVAGSISFGQKDVYRFSLAQQTLLYFDSLTDNSRLRWTLTGPRGSVVVDRSMQSSDASDGTSIFDLAAGDYTLVDRRQRRCHRRLRLPAARPGPGGSRWRSTTSSRAISRRPIRPMPIVSAQRPETASTSTWRRTPAAFRSGACSIRSAAPSGGRTTSRATTSRIHTLALTGSYTLLVEGRRDAGAGTSSYAVRAQRVADKTQAITPGGSFGVAPTWTTGQIGSALAFNGLQIAEVPADAALDLTQTVTLETWVRVDRYADTWTPLIHKGNPADAGDRTYSLWLNANGSVYFGTSNGQGALTAAGLVPAGEWHHLAAVMDRPSGQIRVLVDGVQQASGGVSTNPAKSNAGPLVIGANVEPNGGQGNLRGSLDEIRIWNTARSNEAIVAAKDSALAGSEAGLVAYYKADEGSGATLVDSTAAGRNAVQRSVVAPVVRGTIDHVGQRALHTFTLTAANTRLYFDSLDNQSSLVWSLAGPRGLVVGDRRFDQSDSQNGTSILDLPPGDYTLTVDGVRDHTGEFRFRLLDLAAASALDLGTVVSGTLTPANQTDAYRFSAAAESVFYFDQLAAAGGATFWRLVDPFGQTLWGPSGFGSDAGLMTLPFAGEYTLLIEGRRDASADASYSFRVQPVVDTTTALTLGSVVAGDIEATGQRDLHTFTLDSARRLYFDALTNNSAFRWSSDRAARRNGFGTALHRQRLGRLRCQSGSRSCRRQLHADHRSRWRNGRRLRLPPRRPGVGDRHDCADARRDGGGHARARQRNASLCLRRDGA